MLSAICWQVHTPIRIIRPHFPPSSPGCKSALHIPIGPSPSLITVVPVPTSLKNNLIPQQPASSRLQNYSVTPNHSQVIFRISCPTSRPSLPASPPIAMVPRTSAHIARPLPPSRPIPPTPQRGTIYVVERFGRFSRLLPGNGPPLLPLVDRVIAAYAKRVDQVTPPEGLLALLAASIRVVVNAHWSIRVTDPRKLAYRVSDVDRCVDMLIHVRIRDTLSTLPANINIHDPVVLNRISEAIRIGVDSTAARFGVSCPHFKIVTIRMAEQKPQRSLNLAETVRTAEYYASEFDSVLPELPRDATHTATNSFSSLSPVTQPAYINYPQPIAYPQPIQPVRKQPALASVRLPPPQSTRQPSSTGTPESDDDSLIQLHNSQELPQSQSFRELPTTSPKQPAEEPHTSPVTLARNDPQSRSLPQLIISDEDELTAPNQPSPELETQSPPEIRSSDDETLRAAKSVSAIETSEKASPLSEDERLKPLPALPSNEGLQELLLQELPRDISSLTDETPPASFPEKREILYAPPPSPTASDRQASSSSVSPKVLSEALAMDVAKPPAGVAFASVSSSSEPAVDHVQSRSPATERSLSQAEHVPPAEERAPPLLERLLQASKRDLRPPHSASSSPERPSSPLERKMPGNSEISHVTKNRLTVSEQISPTAELLPQSTPSHERALPTTELSGIPSERAVPLSQQMSAQTTKASPIAEPTFLGQVPLVGSQDRSAPTAHPSSSSGSDPDGFSPPLANIFKTARPTPPSELPESERESVSPPSETHDGPLQSPSLNSRTERTADPTALENPASESPVVFTDSVDQPIPSPLMLNPVYKPPGSVGRDGQNPQTPQLVRSGSNKQSAPTSQSRQAPNSRPLRAGMPLLGPPMILDPNEDLQEQQPAYQRSNNSARGPQTTARGMAPQGYLSPSLPPRAPTPPMTPLLSPVYSPPGVQNGAGPSVMTSPVMAEGLGIGSAPSGRPLPMGVGGTHAAEVGSRVKRAAPRAGLQQAGGTSRPGPIAGEDYPGMQYVQDNTLDSDSEHSNVALRNRPQNASDPKREPQKRRQYVQTSSLFSSAGGKTDRTIKPTASAASSHQQTATRSVRTAIPVEQSQQKLESIHEGAQASAVDARHPTHNLSLAAKENVGGLRRRGTLRSETGYEKDETHLRRDGKRLRTDEEEDTVLRRERARRDKQMNEFDGTRRKHGEGRDSSDDDSTKMMIDAGSDEERERFNENSMYQSGAHSRSRRQKTRGRRHQSRRIDPVDDSDSSSFDEACTECGHHHDGHGHSSSRRKGRNRSSSNRSDGSHQDRSDEESEPRSVSQSRRGRSRKVTSESSVDGRHSDRSSSRDGRSKKSSSRDRKIEKTSSSSRSRSRDGKRSHSKSRSSSKKRDGDDKKRKDSSKSKSKSRDKREVPTREQLEYKSKRSEVKPIYRHRLPESDSGSENPIPWYCEGQSQPEDTDLEDYDGADSSDSDGGKRKRKTSRMYSSYGRRDRHGRRHRARHSRNVTFLYDNRR